MSIQEQLNILGETDPLLRVMIRNYGGKSLQDVINRIEELDAQAQSEKFLEIPTSKLNEQETGSQDRDVSFFPAFPSAVGNYTLTRQIGRGGFGRVFEGFHKDNPNRLVAVKVYENRWLDDIKRLEIEKLVLQKLCHPNLVAAIDAGEAEDGSSYLVMNLIDGVRIDHYVEQHKPGYREIALLFRGIAEALNHAHDRDVVHRDLKPGNILITVDGVPIVTDFGLAKRMNLDDEKSLTATGLLMGTLGYLAPEQADAKRREVTRAVDVYGLGATLYRVLAGVAPFQQDNLLRALEELKSQSPVPPTKFFADVPRDLEQICLKCLAKSPYDRYESMQHLADDLERFAKGERIEARARTRIQELLGWLRDNPVVGGLSVGLVVSVISGLVASTLFWQQAVDQQQITADLLAKAVQMSQSDDRAAERMLTQTPDTLEYRYQRLVASVDFLEELLQTFPDDEELFRESATANFLLGKVCCRQAKWHEAMLAYQVALARFQKQADAHPEDDTLQFDVFHSLLGLDNVDRSLMFVPEKAEGRMTEAFEMIQRLAKSHPGNADYLDALICMRTMIYGRRYPTISPELIGLYEKNFTDAKRLKSQFPEPCLHWRHVGSTAFKLSEAHLELNQLAPAEMWLKIAFDEFDEFLARPDLDPGEYVDWAHCLIRARELELKRGNLQKADECGAKLKEFLKEKVAEFPDYHVFREALMKEQAGDRK